jgi:hypothetical protein
VEQVQIQLQYLDQDYLIQEFIQVVEVEELDLVLLLMAVDQNLVQKVLVELVEVEMVVGKEIHVLLLEQLQQLELLTQVVEEVEVELVQFPLQEQPAVRES